METVSEGRALLRAPEAAEELGLTIKQVYELVAIGELGSVAAPVPGRRGRWVHVFRDDVETYRSAHP